MIYMVRAGSDGPLKIGRAADVRKRLSELQVSHHERLHLLGAMPGDAEEEAAIHARFAAHRLRGEWFRPAAEIIEFAAKHPLPPRPSKRRPDTALGRFLAEQKLTLEAFGALCGRSTATISRLSRGLHKPDWPTIEVIEKATGGKVQPNDWADSSTDPEKPAEAAA